MEKDTDITGPSSSSFMLQHLNLNVLKGALCNFHSHLVVKLDFAFKQIFACGFKCSLKPVGTTASGISQDSRSYDNNMSLFQTN